MPNDSRRQASLALVMFPKAKGNRHGRYTDSRRICPHRRRHANPCVAIPSRDRHIGSRDRFHAAIFGLCARKPDPDSFTPNSWANYSFAHARERHDSAVFKGSWRLRGSIPNSGYHARPSKSTGSKCQITKRKSYFRFRRPQILPFGRTTLMTASGSTSFLGIGGFRAQLSRSRRLSNRQRKSIAQKQTIPVFFSFRRMFSLERVAR